MKFTRPLRTAISASAAAGLICLQTFPALAFDPTGHKVSDAFLTLLDAEDGTVESYGAVAADGNTLTISDLVISNDDKDDGKVMISSTVLTDGEVMDNGRLKLQELSLSGLKMSAPDGGMVIEALKVSDLLMPSIEEMKAGKTAIGPGYQTFEASAIEINDEDGKVVNIEKIVSSIDGMHGDLPTKAQFAVTGARIDVSQLEVKESKSLTDLGYETLSVDLSGSGNWDPDAATLDIPDLQIKAHDAASLALSLSLGGVTQDVIAQLNKKSEDPQEALAVLQNVTINTARIRLDDASLTGRILTQEAQKAGVETPVYVAGLTGSLPLMLGILQNKDLEAKVSQAISEYLNAPGSLEIVAAPGAPVPIAQIVGTAMFSPQMIPQILSLGITANQ